MKLFASLLADKNTTPTTLDLTLFKKWTKEEVRSLLCTDEENGGAGLTAEKVRPLYDAGFDGTSLANIVTDIQDKDKYLAITQLKDTYKEAGIPLTVELSTTLKNVVNWVDNLLKTRLQDFNVFSNLFQKYKPRMEPYPLVVPILPIDFKKSEVMIQKLSENFANLESATDKQHIFLPCLTCAPGTGKSRTLQEIFKYTEQYKKYKDNHIELRLSFGNGTAVTDETIIGEVLCSRILYSYLNIDDFAKLKKNCKNFQFADVITAIVQDWRKNNKKSENTDVAVYLAIDEFTKINDHNIVTLKLVLQLVGQFIQNENRTRNNRIKIFPFFAGLDSTFFNREITESNYHSSYYSPYIYSDDDLIGIVNQFISLEKQSATLWKAITLVNQHPRMLEWLIEEYHKRGDAKKSYEHVESIYEKHYKGKIKLTTEAVKQLIGYTITGHTIGANTKIDGFTIDQLQDNGYIRIENNQLTMSLPSITMLLTENDIFAKFFEIFKKFSFDQTCHHGTDFEIFNAYFEVVLNQSFLNIGKISLTLRERFRGTKFTDEIGSKTINLNTFPSIKQEVKGLAFLPKQNMFQIPASTLVHNTYSRSPFFDRFANAMIENEMWTILWHDRGTVSDYDCFTLPALKTIIEEHFTTEKLAIIEATKEKSLPMIVTTKPYAKTVSCVGNIGLLGREGLEKYYGNFIFRGYLLNISKPFPINNPSKYTDYELALFFGILLGKAKTLRSKILAGEYVSPTSLPQIVGKCLDLKSISFAVEH